ncbi:MAG: rhomboid family intramembrane serine protease [Vicinamibacteria bacterium]
MLVIPIAQQDSTVRRLPYVSFGLIAANVALFLMTSLGAATSGTTSAAYERLDAWAGYLVEHPYLTPRPELAERLGAGFETALSKARSDWQESNPDGAPDRANEQEHLDSLSREAVAALQALPAQRLGFVPREPSLPKALSSMFTHGGWLHLLGNMLFLFLSGPFLEDRYGRGLFAAVYLLSGFAATGFHASQAQDSVVPLVGASGAIAGVMGAFLIRLGKARIQFLVLPIPFLPFLRFKPFLPAFVVLPLWAAEQYLSARLFPESGVAWWAHIGGFAFGGVVAAAIGLMRIEDRWINPSIEAKVTLSQHPGLEAALDARLAGDLAGARASIDAALRAQPGNLDAVREALEIAVAAKESEVASRFACQYLELCSRRNEPLLALELAGDPRWRDFPLTARFYLAAAGVLEKQADARSALDLLALAVRRAPADALAFRGLLRSGEILARAGDARAARKQLLAAQAHPACSEMLRPVVEKALAKLPPPGPEPEDEGPPVIER